MPRAPGSVSSNAISVASKREVFMIRSWKMNLSLIVATIMTASALLGAQVATTPGTTVHMVVTAEARHGNDVPSLQREDVMVYQGRDRVATTDWLPLQG